MNEIHCRSFVVVEMFSVSHMRQFSVRLRSLRLGWDALDCLVLFNIATVLQEMKQNQHLAFS